MRKIAFTITNTMKTLIYLSLILSILMFMYETYVIRGVIYTLGIFLVWLVFFLKILRRSTSSEKQTPITKIEVRLSRLSYFLILLILILPVFFPLLTQHALTVLNQKNNEEVALAISGLISPSLNDTEKARVIFDYVHSTMKNTYFSDVSIPLIGSIGLYHSDRYGFFVCWRIDNYTFANMLWHERCGACREYAMLFMKLAEYSNLTVRMIYDLGEDHSWDEVLLDGQWIVVDPSAGMFNVSPLVYEDQWGKVLSYIYAIYPNGSKVDVTSRYTTTAMVNIIVINKHKEPIPGIKVYVISHNYFKEGRFAGLVCITNRNGRCTIKLGGGAYTLVAKSNDHIPLYGVSYVVLEGNKIYHKNIIVNRNIFHISLPLWIQIVIKGVIGIGIWLCLIILNEIQRSL